MKNFIGALVGGIILFICQFLIWTIIDLHRPAQEYTPKQDEILNYLNNNLPEDGGYFLPNVPKGASMDEQEKLMETSAGKPWAQIFYHKNMNTNMVANILLNLVCDVAIVFLFCFVISGITRDSFGKVLLAAFFTGLIVFLNTAYTANIWFETFDLQASFIEYMIEWLLVGIWLGWWLNRKKAAKRYY